jgi:hypothetical protein
MKGRNTGLDTQKGWLMHETSLNLADNPDNFAAMT